MKYVIGLDYGSDSCRAVVVDAISGAEMASAVKYYPRWMEGKYCVPTANQYRQHPLDYIEGGPLNKRREEISEWLDATNPDLSAFYKRGGKIIVTVGTMDNIASSGAQLDYYQSLINKMGQKKIDDFARLYVIPQASHGLSGKSYKMNGEGKSVIVRNIPRPNSDDKIDMLIFWVEKNQAPAKTLVVGENGRIDVKVQGKGYLLCSYPNYPRYIEGPTEQVSSYVSAAPVQVP